MIEKYRYNFEEYEFGMKDEMLFHLNHMIVGISMTPDNFIVNHYDKTIDMSEYVKVEMGYDLQDFANEYFDYTINMWGLIDNNV